VKLRIGIMPSHSHPHSLT